MKNSLIKTARWSALAVSMGIMSISAFQAQAAIFWPGATGDTNKDTDFQEGYNDGQDDCRNAPQPCGVTLYPMTKEQGYGETEPNDHILNADGLLLGQFYHANSLGEFDEDWYHVVTDKPSQKLTLYFLADAGNFADTAGWVIQVRDLNGNIIAAFDSATAGSDGGEAEENTDGMTVEDGVNTPNPTTETDLSPVDLAKITEVTLGKAGTYYISVRSKEGKGQLRGYNIAATLENTGQVTANPDENRFDTETEPNDTKGNADPLRSNVAMVGVFDRTLIKRIEVTTPPATEIKYFYTGCNVQNISSIPAGQTDCACDLTSVDNNGNIVPLNPNVNNGQLPQAPADACEAREIITPATTEWVGIFDYDVDTYVYHSEGNEQLRIQICTRTDCQFSRVHLRVNKDNTGIVLMEGPVVPGQVIDLGAAMQGDYYFEFSAEETGVVSDTGDSQVDELLGPYDILLMSTKMSPHGN
ncbi:hypothetical protein [Thiolapillus sp.]